MSHPVWAMNHTVIFACLLLGPFLVSASELYRLMTAAADEVSANFCGLGSVAWSAQRVPTAVNLGILDQRRYFFIQVAPHLSSRGSMDPVPDPLLVRKFGSVAYQTRDLWVCSQELWPQDRRGGRPVTYNP
jgi:hypothetical protein